MVSNTGADLVIDPDHGDDNVMTPGPLGHGGHSETRSDQRPAARMFCTVNNLRGLSFGST